MVLGYPDHLVAGLLDRLETTEESRVLDPFCGSGTTLVECMKRGIKAVGIDANPAGVMAATVKTNWSLNDGRLSELLEATLRSARVRARSRTTRYQSDATYRYLSSSGMIRRGWISGRPLKKAIAIKRAIKALPTNASYKNALLLCLISEVVFHASNVKFGPEIYCSKRKVDVDVLSGFANRVHQMVDDLRLVANCDSAPPAVVVRGDARKCGTLLRARKFDRCICSPPYPTEHDYTRNARLELAFLEQVTDIESLRAVKKSMIRSHSKNIYKSDRDNDKSDIGAHEAIVKLAAKLRRKVKGTHGFVELYPDVVLQYFGGMKHHFKSLKKILAPGARCAYVVGDQSSYCGVHIPTADLLGTVLKSLGFVDISIVNWRGRWSTSRSQEVDENILFFSTSSEA